VLDVGVPPTRRDESRRAGWWRGALVDEHVGRSAELRPSALAIVDGATRLDYLQLNAAVNSVASGLVDLGVRGGDVVSWQLPNWHEAIVLHNAVLRVGAVSNPIIPILREREVGYILAEAHSKVVVVPHRFRNFDYPAMIDAVRPELPALRHVVEVRPDGHGVMSFDDLLGGDPNGPGPGHRDADDPILLMFTSGTTALPKGVLHTHETLDYENRSIIAAYGLTDEDVVFMPSPVSHITGLLYGIQLPSMLGIPVVLQDVWEPTAALALIETERCSFTLAATPFLAGLTQHPALSDTDVSSLRVFACGGADVPPALVRQADDLLGCRTVRVYGSTEFPTLSTSSPMAPLGKRAETDGAAIGAAEYRIVDGAEQDVPVGGVGELLVRGPELFISYLDPNENADAFAPGGWFRTGDLASCDEDSYLTIRGRSKDIILRGGENISVAEVEQLLFEHPDVREVAIVAMPDPVMTERACAFVVAEPRTTPTLADLCAFLETKKIARQKFPERLELIPELPKTLSGKIQKFRLREVIRDKLMASEAAPRRKESTP
jgi:cyclohexanecarboxylate-CoA ligase